MNALKTLALLAAATVLSGCLHVQLFGSVGGAQVVITSLRNTSDIVDRGESRDRQAAYELRGKKNWESDGPMRQLWTIGVFAPSQELDDDTLYLARATGGFDEDINTDNRLDETGTPVNGSWHAILSGEQAKGYYGKISVLTEAIYQVVRDEGLNGKTDAQVIARMNELATAVVEDLNKDGVVDYDDVLTWSRLFKPGSEGAGLSDPSLLALAILEGSPQEDLLSLSRQVLGLD